jgi:amino acid adenylation domain-containing protein
MTSNVKKVEAVLPLSPMQQGMLFHTLADPQSGMYLVQVSCVVPRALNIAAFRKAWERVIDRHSIFRTAFAINSQEEPLQVVGRSVKLPIHQQDWRNISASRQESFWQELLRSDRQSGVNLSKAPLMRLTLIRISEDSYRLLWTHHHILLDGWSTSIVLKELASHYEVFTRYVELQLPPCRPFGDYIAWLQKQDLNAAERYWRRRLDGFTEATGCEPDGWNEQTVDGEGYRQEEIQFTEAETATLESAARRDHVSLNTFVQGAWAILLSRYSRRREVVFGVTLSGRPPELAGVESIVGLFINTLPMRLDAGPEHSLLPWLEKVQLQQAELQQYSYTPLIEVQKWSQLPQGNPLFETIVVFENYGSGVEASEQQSALRLEIVDVQGRVRINYPLTLVAAPGRYFSLRADYDSSRFARPAIENLLNHVKRLLLEIASKPNACVADLEMLSETERVQLLTEWNQERRAYEGEQSITERWRRQVESGGNRIAIVCGSESLSYWELDRRANRLAHRLRREGVRPESRVGVWLERGVDMVVALLGALKAGAAYVPLDHSQPKQRLSYLLSDMQARIVVSQRAGGDQLPEYDGKLVLVDEEMGKEPEEAPETPAASDNIAYMIYTSGSTGNPKGVEVTHGNVLQLLASTQDRFRFGPDDVWTMYHSYAFDFSVWELWGALLNGGRVVIVPYQVSRSPETFYELIEQEGVTVLNLTPSAFGQLMQVDGWEGADLGVRTVIFGGEALNIRRVRDWWRRHGERASMVNMYGITETTVHVTYRRICEEDTQGPVRSLIGEAIPSLQIYVLGAEMQPVPVSVIGELYVGGAGLARGYWGRPDLTAERFIPNPFGEVGSRIYRSGDLVRYLPNGDLEYLGRADHQVKIRGFRIELGEIETALRSHASVREAVVMARTEESGEKRLVAYLVGNADRLPNADRWRQELKQQLPEYMIPTVFVALERLPLTSNGKVDRKALPAPEGERPELEWAYEAPRTSAEEKLAEIWSQVLRVERVGVHDNFFALGGDSMRIIQIRALARKNGLEISVPQLLQYQTIAELAQQIDTVPQQGDQKQEIRPFNMVNESDRRKMPDGIEDAYPFAYLQAGMLFHSEYAPDSAIYHDVFSYHLETRFDVDALASAIRSALERHAVLRTSFHLAGFSEPLQLVHRAAEAPLIVDDFRNLQVMEQEAFIAAWIGEEKRNRFEWTKCPLIRFRMHRRTEESFQFTVSFHHAILDGWSLASLLTEIFKDYLSRIEGHAAPRVSIPETEFKHFVALERRATASDECRRFWLEKLAGSAMSALPRWRKELAAIRDFVIRPLSISTEVGEGLKLASQRMRVSLKSVLLAAHLRVLAFVTGQTDVVTGLVSHGRLEDAGGDAVLGLFLNTLPLRLKLSGGSWQDLTLEIFEADREMFPHRYYPIAEIQNLLGGQSLFETAFNFTHFHVYHGISRFPNIRVLGEMGYDETNFTLLANFAMHSISGRIQLRLDYDRAVLSDPQIEAIEGYYLRALASIAGDLEARYDSICLLSDSERRQLEMWNKTAVETADNRSIHRLFEMQAARTPGATALKFEDKELTYSEVEARANALASILQSAGARPDMLIGICLERDAAIPIAVLGVLKSGAAYLPLDPSHPVDRLKLILAESGAPIVLSRRSLADRLTGYDGKVIWLDQIEDETLSENCSAKVPLDCLAYMIYTSGSTGRPKGIGLSHRALINLLAWYGSRQREGARVIQFASLSFDVSFLEIFSTWLSGGELFVCPERGRRDPEFLANFLSFHGIERAVLPVVMLQQIAELYDPGKDNFFQSLREIIATGEQLRITPAIVRFFERIPHCSLENHYGPSEAHVVTAYTLPRDPSCWTSHPPIGKPIANIRTHLLDEFLNPVPVGTTAQLYLGGVGLARGYLNQPDLTAKKFVPDPSAAEPGTRLYQTGDLARRLPDGEIEFLGRMDHQVKIRGFRVELSEIESFLTKQPGVREAVVVAIDGTSGDRYLVGYVVPAEDFAPSAYDLKNALGAKLPEYMVPSTFIFLDAFPLNANRKVDYKRLPAPSRSERFAMAEFVAPRNPAEELVAAAWRDVLRVEAVGVYDNFFELGGNSLRATQVVARLRDTLQIELPLRTLFDHPTIEHMVEAIAELHGGIEAVEEIALIAQTVIQLSGDELTAMLDYERAASV